MNKDTMRHLIDEGFSRLSYTPGMKRVALANMTGGKIVKRKISTAFVFVLITLLIGGIALAAISLRDTAREVAITEREEGPFGYWQIDKKIALINALAELGYIKETAVIGQTLTDEEANRIAYEAITAFVGKDAKETGFMDIMQSAWGHFDGWTREEQAWYTILMDEIGIEQGDKTRYVMPEGDVTEAEAVAIARREIAEGFGVAQSELDPYEPSAFFEIPEFAEPGDQPFWHIVYVAPESMPRDERIFHDFEVFIHPKTGALYESVESMLARRGEHIPVKPANALTDAINAYSERAEHMPFRMWPIELKAEYSLEVNPMVRAILESGDLTDLIYGEGPDVEIIARASFDYGMPGEGDLTQEEAFAIAKRTLHKAHDVDEAVFDLYREICVYFDVTDAENPLWKFYFNPKSLSPWELAGGQDDPLRDLCFKAEVNARTGEVVKSEAFTFRILGRDLEQYLRLY